MFLLMWFSSGSYCESYEYIHTATLSGRVTDNSPAYMLYPIANIGVGHLYKLLFTLFPEFSWYYFSSVLLFVIALSTIYYSIGSVYSYRKAIIWCVAITIIYAADFVLNWNITRISFLLCTAAIALLFNYTQTRSLKDSAIHVIAGTILFSLGFLIRPESGLLILFISLPLVIIHLGFNWRLIRVAFIFVPALILSLVIFIDKQTTSEFYIKLSPIEEYRIALDYILPIDSMKTAEDTVKYLALKNGMLNDNGFINHDFVNRIVNGSKVPLFSSNQMLRTIEILRSIFIENISQTIFYILIVLLLLLSQKKFSLKGKILFWGMLLISTSLIWGISYFMTMEARVFVPLLFHLVVMSLCLFHQHIENYFDKNTFPIKFVLIASVAAISIYAMVNHHKTKELYLSTIAGNKEGVKKLIELSHDKILVPDANGFMLLFFNNYLPNELPKYDAFKKIFLIDIETLSLSPDYKKFLDKHCNCNSSDLAAFYDYLYSIKGEVVFAASAERMQLFEDYLRIVRKRDYVFIPYAQIPNVNSDASPTSLFRMEKNSKKSAKAI